MSRLPAFLVMTALCAAPAYAHHGPGTFELGKSVTYTGKLTRIDFVNPHSWLYFEVTDANGKVTKHRCEMRSAHTLRRSGWTKELFPINSKVVIEAAPDRADPASCYLNTIRFENGSHMDRYGQYVKAAGGGVQEVRGAGVVGEQPLLRPQESFEYTSGAAIATPVGTMRGSYQMVSEEGIKFDVPIPEFTLAVPRILH